MSRGYKNIFTYLNFANIVLPASLFLLVANSNTAFADQSGIFTSPPISLPAGTSILDSLNWQQSGLPLNSEGETLFQNKGLLESWNFNDATGNKVKTNTDCLGGDCAGELLNFQATDLEGSDQNPLSGWTKSNKKWGGSSLVLSQDNQVKLKVSKSISAENNINNEGLSIGFWWKNQIPTPADTTQTIPTSESRPLISFEESINFDTDTKNNASSSTHTSSNQAIFSLNNKGQLTFGQEIINFKQIADKNWHYTVWTLNNTGENTIYIDGQAFKMEDVSSSNASKIIKNPPKSIIIGGQQTGNESWMIDAMHIFGRQLSAAEVISQTHITDFKLKVATFNHPEEMNAALEKSPTTLLSENPLFLDCQKQNDMQNCIFSLTQLEIKPYFAYQVEISSQIPNTSPTISGFNLNYQNNQLGKSYQGEMNNPDFAVSQNEVNQLTRHLPQDLGSKPEYQPHLSWDQYGVSSQNQINSDEKIDLIYDSENKTTATNATDSAKTIQSIEIWFDFSANSASTSSNTDELRQLIKINESSTISIDNSGKITLSPSFVNQKVYLNGIDISSSLTETTLQNGGKYYLAITTPNSIKADQSIYTSKENSQPFRLWSKEITPANIISHSQNVTLDLQSRTSADGINWSSWSSLNQTNRLLWEDFENEETDFQNAQKDNLLKTSQYQSLLFQPSKNNNPQLSIKLNPLQTTEYNRLSFYAAIDEPLTFNLDINDSQKQITNISYQLKQSFTNQLAQNSLQGANQDIGLTQNTIDVSNYDQLANLIPGDTIIIRENKNEQTYTVQGIVEKINPDTQSITVKRWQGQIPYDEENQLFFFSSAAKIFKWQKFYLDLNQFPNLGSNQDISLIDQLIFSFPEDISSNFWIDEIEALYLNQSSNTHQTLPIQNQSARYLQTQVITTSKQLPLSAQIANLKFNQIEAELKNNSSPQQRLRGGKSFIEQSLTSLGK